MSLQHLYIKHFTIIDQLEIDLVQGLTVITGETGAGKSIMVDALKLALGERAGKQIVKQGFQRCEVSATFAINENQAAKIILTQLELDHDDTCLLRRIITADGRSKASINGTPVSLRELRMVADTLIAIQGQHDHQSLFYSHHQLNCVDAFASLNKQALEVQHAFEGWKQATQARDQLLDEHSDAQSKMEFLQFQLDELTSFSPQSGEFSALHQTQERLAHQEELQVLCQHSLQLLQESDQTSINQQLHQCQHNLIQAQKFDSELSTVQTLVAQALTHAEEASLQLKQLMPSSNEDPQQLNEIEQRLSQYHELARKHQVLPENLHQHFEQLQINLDKLQHFDAHHQALDDACTEAAKHYTTLASKLSTARMQAAKQLSTQITTSIQQLNMPHAKLEIQIKHDPTQFSPHGSDQCKFMVTTNAGQALAPLNQIASGGELSRINLAIQVITSQTMSTPTLIFDEVDTGISGQTAAVVGQLLQQLGHSVQVLAITHLPQVASFGNTHLNVEKTNTTLSTETIMTQLNENQRIDEIARMLGGMHITEASREAAKSLIHIANTVKY